MSVDRSDMGKPVAVFRFSESEGPGHFATFLEARGLPWTLVRLDQGEAVPPTSEGFSGLGLMGGPMSANDPLPWVEPMLSLIRDAAAREIPVIGHCLGGQLLARALGGEVRVNPVKEIGWNRVEVVDSALARDWFGAQPLAFDTFQWHGETFSIPPEGERILTGPHCANQAYVVAGRHLGMQCHVEMTPGMIEDWCRTGADEIRANLGLSPAVQDATAIGTESPGRLPGLNAMAETLYERWIRNLRR